MNVSVCVNDNLLPLTNHAFPASELEKRRTEFAFLKEIANDPNDEHPILKFIHESDIQFSKIETKPKKGLCLICPDAAYPARPMDDVSEWVKIAINKGYTHLISGSDLHAKFTSPDITPSMAEKVALVERATWVIGAENEYVFLAAARGIDCTIINGSGLFERMFPK